MKQLRRRLFSANIEECRRIRKPAVLTTTTNNKNNNLHDGAKHNDHDRPHVKIISIAVFNRRLTVTITIKQPRRRLSNLKTTVPVTEAAQVVFYKTL